MVIVMMWTSTLSALLLLFVAASGSEALGQNADWSTFNGDLAAQKYSPLTQITPQNVGELAVVWRTHTGDVSAGGPPPSGIHIRPAYAGSKADVPPTVWSATPLFVNDTVYLGTPFYRIFALEPDTGKMKWTYDTKAVLEALTQPDLKNRGVAYWQADTAVAGQPCQKRVYIGTMDAKLHSVDADTGKPCSDFGKAALWTSTNGISRTRNGRCPSCNPQPYTRISCL